MKIPELGPKKYSMPTHIIQSPRRTGDRDLWSPAFRELIRGFDTLLLGLDVLNGYKTYSLSAVEKEGNVQSKHVTEISTVNSS